MRTIAFGDRTFRGLCIEDTRIDRLYGAAHWNDDVDRRRALLLARAHLPDLDLEHLAVRAGEDGVGDASEKVLARARAGFG